MIKYLKQLFIVAFVIAYSTTFSQSTKPNPFADTVFAYICSKNILHPTIVMQQAIVETGNFYPNSLMKKNNLFGFRIQGSCLTFNTWQESVDYYKAWQDRKYKNTSEDYYVFLRRIGYATSPEYAKKLKNTGFTKTCPCKQEPMPVDSL